MVMGDVLYLEILLRDLWSILNKMAVYKIWSDTFGEKKVGKGLDAIGTFLTFKDEITTFKL